MSTLSMRRQRGVTLLELLLVVSIVGIIAAIAYPSYRTHILRSNRTEARVTLEQTAGALEKCYTRYMAYNDTTNCPVAAQVNSGFNTTTGHYRITGALGATTFTLTATAQSTGGQSADTACATLGLDQTGNRTGATTTCW